MSTSTRIMRSKGESDGLSLPMKTRPTRKDTISGRNGGMALNITFNAGQDQQQQMLTLMSHLPTQSPQGATNQHIKDAVLRNHSNLRTMSQRSNAYHQLHQKPDEALQTYNTRYASSFNLAYPELEIDNSLSRMHCIHYASSLYGKLRDEMTGRFNQDLPENL